MAEDYLDAASRHLQDARTLKRSDPASLPGASHLFGFAAECALKALLQPASGGHVQIKGHLQAFWQEFETHGSLARRHAIRSQAVKFKSNFSEWDVAQRYAHRGETCFGEPIVDKQGQAAEGLVNLVHNVRKGLIA